MSGFSGDSVKDTSNTKVFDCKPGKSLYNAAKMKAGTKAQRDKRESLSAPLLMTCTHTLDFDE
jgi:hypothetical protein